MQFPKMLKFCLAQVLVALSVPASADTGSASSVPQSGFFVGIGGSQNWLNFNKQETWALGTTSAPAGPNNPAISGSAEGSTGVNLPSQSQFSPSIQLGYFSHFQNSDVLWGAKLSYSYLGGSSQSNNQLIPQAGGYNNGSGGYSTFTGNYLARSYQQTVRNQFSFTPFIGYSFSKSYVYAGAGPSVSQVTTNINGITGFADIFGFPSDISGSLQNYSATQWLVGGTATVGITYFFDDSYFLDFSYSYTQTQNSTASWGGPWSKQGIWSPGGFNAVPYTGTNQGTSSGNVANQSIMLTINKAF